MENWTWIQGAVTALVTALGIIATQLSTNSDRARNDRDKFYQYWQDAENKCAELRIKINDLEEENETLKKKIKEKENEII